VALAGPKPNGFSLWISTELVVDLAVMRAMSVLLQSEIWKHAHRDESPEGISNAVKARMDALSANHRISF